MLCARDTTSFITWDPRPWRTELEWYVYCYASGDRAVSKVLLYGEEGTGKTYAIQYLKQKYPNVIQDIELDDIMDTIIYQDKFIIYVSYTNNGTSEVDYDVAIEAI